MRNTIGIIMVLLIITVADSRSIADVSVTVIRDRAEWETAIGNFNTITFTEIPPNTILHNQYLSSGIQFSDMNSSTQINPNAFPTDLHGAVGFGPIHAFMGDGFNVIPAQWIAVEFETRIAFRLLRNSQVIYESSDIYEDESPFVGLISSVPFDEIYMLRLGGGPVFIDNLYFGIPAPGALAVFGFAALFGGARRRRW